MVKLQQNIIFSICLFEKLIILLLSNFGFKFFDIVDNKLNRILKCILDFGSSVFCMKKLTRD